MWSEVAEVAVDVFGPSASPDLDRLFDKKDPNLLRVPLIEQDAFKRRLNASGWFDEEVVAAGLLTQGEAQSLISLLTGWGLIQMVRPRRNKSLPREFCVAVTAGRVVLLVMSAWSEGGEGTDVVHKVKREECGSWSRGSVRIHPDGRKLRSGLKGGTVEIAGLEPFPVNWANWGSEEVVESLASG
jgi:hypothetical protein